MLRILCDAGFILSLDSQQEVTLPVKKKLHPSYSHSRYINRGNAGKKKDGNNVDG